VFVEIACCTQTAIVCAHAETKPEPRRLRAAAENNTANMRALFGEDSPLVCSLASASLMKSIRRRLSSPDLLPVDSAASAPACRCCCAHLSAKSRLTRQEQEGRRGEASSSGGARLAETMTTVCICKTLMRRQDSHHSSRATEWDDQSAMSSPVAQERRQQLWSDPMVEIRCAPCVCVRRIKSLDVNYKDNARSSPASHQKDRAVALTSRSRILCAVTGARLARSIEWAEAFRAAVAGSWRR
jgi:hypothetical protein